MGRLGELMMKKVLGDEASSEDTNNGGMPPFLLNVLKNFGITPESITAYAETIKTAVLETRADIADIKARCIVLEEELCELHMLVRSQNPEAASTAPIPEVAPDLNAGLHMCEHGEIVNNCSICSVVHPTVN